jgi:hypothetical protein
LDIHQSPAFRDIPASTGFLCERKGNGTVYTEKMREWFGIDHTTASHWLVLGQNQTLAAANTRLPPSLETLYLLCNVPSTRRRSEVGRVVQSFVTRAKFLLEKRDSAEDASG